MGREGRKGREEEAAAVDLWLTACCHQTPSTHLSSAQVLTRALASTPPRRYLYLQGPDGSFQNPFSRSLCANIHEALHPESTPQAPTMLPGSLGAGGIRSHGGCRNGGGPADPMRVPLHRTHPCSDGLKPLNVSRQPLSVVVAS
jgi:hypothetical protein